MRLYRICRDVLEAHVSRAHRITAQKPNQTGESTGKRKGDTHMATKVSKGKTARSLALAHDGITSGVDFARVMSALMSDVLEGAITPEIANATVNAGGKLLKVVEMQYKYAPPKFGEQPMLVLAPPIDAIE